MRLSARTCVSLLVLLVAGPLIGFAAQPSGEPAAPPALQVPNEAKTVPAPTPTPDVSLSLSAAIDVALENNPDMRATREALEASEANFDLAHSPYRSLVDLGADASARYMAIHEIAGGVILNPTRSAQEGRPVYDYVGRHGSRHEDHEEVGFNQTISKTFRNATRLDLTTTERLEQDSVRYYDDDEDQDHDLQSSVQVSYTIPLNSRERVRIRTTLDNAELGYEQALNSLYQQREQVIYSVNTNYWNLKYSEQNLAIQKDYLAQAQRTYESFNVKLEYGFASEFEVKQSRVAMRRIESNLVGLRSRLRNDYESFNILLGMPLDYRTELTDELVVPEIERSKEEYVELALDTNLQLKNMRLSIEESENSLALTRLGQQPNISLGTSYMRDDGGDAVANVSFNFSWPFGDGGATAARVRAAESRLQDRRIRLADEERQLRQQVLDLLRQIQTAEEQLIINEENVNLSQEALDIANFRFENGQIEFRDLQDAQIDLADSRVTYTGTVRTLNIAIAALEALIHQY